MNKALKIYLDTSDYSSLTGRDNDPKLLEIFKYLIHHKKQNNIKIYYSMPIISEALKFNKAPRDLLLKKAKTIRLLCDSNCFVFLSNVIVADYNQDYNSIFSSQGEYYPEKESIDIIKSNFALLNNINRKTEKIALKLFCREKCLSETAKNINDLFSNLVLFTELMDKFPDLGANIDNWIINFENKFLNSTANIKNLNIPIKTERVDTLSVMEKILEPSEINNINKEMIKKSKTFILMDLFINNYLKNNINSNRNIKKSDGGDFLHALFLPYCDIWRGDTYISNLIITNKICDNFNTKVCKKLVDLPDLIDELLKLNN